MIRNELIKNLEYTKQKYKDKFVMTGETNVYEMVSDMLRYLNQPTTEINIDYYEELKAKADNYDDFKVIIDMTESVVTKNANSKLPIPIIRYSDFLKLKEKADKWDEKEKGADVIDNCICDSCSSTVNKKMIYCAECGIKLNWSE